MSTVHIPSAKEIADIAYLVCRGWTPDYNAETWSKAGIIREPTYEETHWSHSYQPDLTAWNLEDAVYCQQALDEKEAKHGTP